MSVLTLDQIREIGNFPEIDMYSRIAFKDALIKWNEKQASAVSELSQSLPEIAQDPNTIGGDDDSGKPNVVVDAYSDYIERQRIAYKKLCREW